MDMIPHYQRRPDLKSTFVQLLGSYINIVTTNEEVLWLLRRVVAICIPKMQGANHKMIVMYS